MALWGVAPRCGSWRVTSKYNPLITKLALAQQNARLECRLCGWQFFVLSGSSLALPSPAARN